MKRSVFYIIISLVALAAMFGIQLFSVLRIYSLEQGKFDYRYQEIIRSGVDELENKKPGVSFGTAYVGLDYVSRSLLKSYYTMDYDSSLLMPFRKVSFSKIHDKLVAEQGLQQVIKKLLESEGEYTEFNTHIKISELSFFSFRDTIKIYDEDVDGNWNYTDTLNIPDVAILVNSISSQGTNFSITFNSYIDFVDKRKIIIGQMVGILIIMGLALLLVAGVFVITLKNMLEERRLSLLKTDFINNMTHELKTPLSTIAIATKTMANPAILEDKEKVASMAQMISRQNKYLSMQINHLLEVSMWEKGQFELDRKEFELKPYLQALAEAFRWECKDKNLTLTEKYDGIDGLNVCWDETQMTTAIHNILVNSAKYCNTNPIIELNAKRDNILTIEIRDNGIGISKEQQKHIFDKFYRVHTGNIHKVKGLGLGLFYVKQIVEAHKGEILLKSKINSGSTFTIKIPYHG